MSTVQLVSPEPADRRQLHKFGGSSLADPDCYRRVTEILREYSGAQDLIVVSAAGKTTNRLIEWIELLDRDGRLAHDALMSLRQYQQELIESLLGDESRGQLVDILFSEFAALAEIGDKPIDEATRAYILGHGEQWSARLLAALLTELDMPASNLDSRTFLRAERAAQPEVDRSRSWPLLQTQLAQHGKNRVVITGFMAQNVDGETVLLGRNGSDYSATVIGALADVARVTIWSDVAGVYSADPRKVEDACLLPLLRLDEAAELARLAAPVLHSRTLQPVAHSVIDLALRSSYQPDSGSTRIERVLASGRGAKIVTSHEEICLIELELPRGHDFETARTDIERLLTRLQLQPLAMTVEKDPNCVHLAYTAEVVNSVLERLQDAGVAAEIRLREDFVMIAVVGAGVSNNPVHSHGFHQQLRGQPVEFIAESANGLSLVAVVRRIETGPLVAAIHCALFQAQRRIGVALMGKGSIGSRWLSLFAEQKDALEKRHGMSFSLLCVADSQRAWVDLKGINPAEVDAAFDDTATPLSGIELFRMLSEHDYDDLVVLDVTASRELAGMYPDLAEMGFHLISANKVAGSAPEKAYNLVKDAFAKTGRHWLYNATVGAGLPINHTVRDLRESGDQIMAISGIFSGTLSWLFQQYDGSFPFSQLLEQAWQQGLTEPDPREDLNGRDVARKLVILARESGLEVDPDRVKVESLVPEALADLNVEQFFDQCHQLDDILRERVEDAHKEQKVLRYVARLTKEGVARVGMEALPDSHPFANLLPCDTVFAVESRWYRENPLVIQGPGAGRDVTAGALLSDLNRIATLL